MDLKFNPTKFYFFTVVKTNISVLEFEKKSTEVFFKGLENHILVNLDNKISKSF